MLRRLLVGLLIAALMTLVVGTTPAGAREILGCNGLIQWPCPGPVLVDP
jgi:hypothetical protein